MSKSLVEEIDLLVARAETARFDSERRQALEEAVTKACAAMKSIVRQVETIAASVMTVHGLTERGEMAFRDQVNSLTDGSLAVFASPESLRQHLDATKPLIQQQLDGSGRTADQFVATVLAMYDDYIGQRISSSNLVIWCNRLQSLFCRPPGGSSDYATPPLLPDDSGGGATAERREIQVREWIAVIAAVVAAVAAVAQVFVAARKKQDISALADFGDSEERSKLGLCGFLLLGAVVSQADDHGLLPAYTEPYSRGSGFDTLTEREVEALLRRIRAYA